MKLKNLRLQLITLLQLVFILGASASYSIEINPTEILQLWNHLQTTVAINPENTPNNFGTTYKTNQPPSVAQATRALHFLEFSEAVNGISAIPEGWKRMESFRHDSGLFGSVFVKGKNAVIAFRGSEIGATDWINNAFMATGVTPPQYSLVIDGISVVANRYSAYTTHFTGHSLGGGLAATAALITGHPATTFNASGINSGVLEKIRMRLKSTGHAPDSWKQNARKITNFNLEGDFLSDLDFQQDADVLGMDAKQYGDIYYLSAARFTPLPIINNGVTRHLIAPLKEELRFLAQPFYRRDPNASAQARNEVNARYGSGHGDPTDDTVDILGQDGAELLQTFPGFFHQFLN